MSHIQKREELTKETLRWREFLTKFATKVDSPLYDAGTWQMKALYKYLSSRDAEVESEVWKKAGEIVKGKLYSEDLEDLGGEAIADHAYENKFEAFRYGYNQACSDIASIFTSKSTSDKVG